MCTVIFSPRRRGYILGMNRDEKRTRPLALPPSVQRVKNTRSILPSEPGGGTWIAVNDLGISLALVNWYSMPPNRKWKLISRGLVVKSLLECKTPEDVSRALSKLSLARMNPFRLIGFFPGSKQVVEWRWNVKKLRAFKHPWKSSAWISSGFDESGAQKTRGNTFSKALGEKSSGSLAWLRRLHRSHGPAKGPYSICMHRDDAVTVSYTEVQVRATSAKMRYLAGAPCSAANESIQSLALKGH